MTQEMLIVIIGLGVVVPVLFFVLIRGLLKKAGVRRLSAEETKATALTMALRANPRLATVSPTQQQEIADAVRVHPAIIGFAVVWLAVLFGGALMVPGAVDLVNNSSPRAIGLVVGLVGVGGALVGMIVIRRWLIGRMIDALRG